MGDGATLLPLALEGLAPGVLLALVAWVASLVQRDASLVDRFWPWLVAGPALVYFLRWPGSGARGAWALALAVAWAVRLALHITVRNWGHGEDRRYARIRARNEPRFGIRSLYLVFGLQAALAWLVSAPLLAAVVGTRPLGALDAAGIAVAGFGIAFEALGDAQLARFKSDPAHRGQVMDRGLWAWTRHPNYFGEACLWWGLWLMALAAGGAGAWTVVSPITMTFLLLKVSGVSLLEHDLVERRPAYRDYIERTNAFVPGPPRRRAGR